ncbi:MAG: hypothetical protein OXG49_06040 [Chloroflexi bacterium]|nr:hypothetical protein [Chloroflexota bacterium]
MKRRVFTNCRTDLNGYFSPHLDSDLGADLGRHFFADLRSHCRATCESQSDEETEEHFDFHATPPEDGTIFGEKPEVIQD